MLRNVNDVLMAHKPAPPKMEWEMVVCWAVCYVRRLVRSPFPNDPLVGNLYAGQAVRPVGKVYPTAQSVAEKRWKEEDQGAKHGNGSDLCFLEVLRVYGPEAFDTQIVWQTKGLRWQVQPLADEKEIALVAENGGPLRDTNPDVHIEQTFNRKQGGKGYHWYEGLCVALSAKRWHVFKDEMLKHVAKFKTARVGQQYISSTGYPLGFNLSNVRSQEQYIKGYPSRRAWLEALPGWTWNARNDEIHRNCMSKQVTEWHRSNLDKELIHARTVSVPFEKSKKRRAEMRAASQDNGGRRGCKLLYMISEDGMTIRRVTKDGMMRKRTIVGCVVDQAPDGAYDSDSD